MVYGFDENLNRIDVKDKATQEGVDSGQDDRLTALETGKQDKLTAGTNVTISGTTISAKDTTYNVASTSTNGLMSSSDKSKLDGIATGATKNTVDTALSTTSTNAVQNKVITSALNGKLSTSGTAAKATADASGNVIVDTYETKGNAITGLSVSGKVITYTKGDGNTGTITTQDTNTTYGVATTSANGLMSSSDKSKLDGIASGANKTTVDSALSSSSTNPVQNKVINSALSGKLSTSGTAAKATADASGNNIVDTYETKANAITGLSASGTTITYTKGDGTTGTITTQDKNTDTKNTTGTSNKTGTKLFLAGATSQATNPVTYSNSNVYIGTDNKLYSGGKVVIASGDKATSAGTADSATNATNDGDGNEITDTYETKANAITGLSVSGKVVTYTKGDGSTGTITTQDTNTTYSVASSSANGLMSSTDKAKLDAITASADAVSVTASLTSGTKVGTITVNGTGTDLYCETNTDTDTTYSAGSGLSLSGTTFNHSNSVTAKTTYVGSATAVPMIKYDAQGHITAMSTATIYPPTSAGTSGQYWSSDGSGTGVWRDVKVDSRVLDYSAGYTRNTWYLGSTGFNSFICIRTDHQTSTLYIKASSSGTTYHVSSHRDSNNGDGASTHFYFLPKGYYWKVVIDDSSISHGLNYSEVIISVE